MQVKESGIPIAIANHNPSSTDKESRIHYLESRIHVLQDPEFMTVFFWIL